MQINSVAFTWSILHTGSKKELRPFLSSLGHPKERVNSAASLQLKPILVFSVLIKQTSMEEEFICEVL